jgi:hypothetical protein
VNGWIVDLSKGARREFRLLEDGPKRDATDLMEDLREQGPVVEGALKMRAYPDTWRVRIHRKGTEWFMTFLEAGGGSS